MRFLKVGGQAQKEMGAVGIPVLLGLDDIAAGIRDEGGHRRDDAAPVRTAERQYQALRKTTEFVC